jgi:hypothetical protein
MAHESFQRRDDKAGSSNRNFGLVFAVVFAIIGLLPLVHGGALHLWALIVAVPFLVVALVAPALLAPLNKLWTRFGMLLHRIVSPVILGLLFFVIITPMGAVMRLLGKDPLRLRRDPQSPSYWITRSPPGPPAESFVDQF